MVGQVGQEGRFCLEGSKSNTVSQLVSHQGRYKAVRAAKMLLMIMYNTASALQELLSELTNMNLLTV